MSDRDSIHPRGHSRTVSIEGDGNLNVTFGASRPYPLKWHATQCPTALSLSAGASWPHSGSSLHTDRALRVNLNLVLWSD